MSCLKAEEGMGAGDERWLAPGPVAGQGRLGADCPAFTSSLCDLPFASWPPLWASVPLSIRSSERGLFHGVGVNTRVQSRPSTASTSDTHAD